MTPRQFWTPNFQFSRFDTIQGKVFSYSPLMTRIPNLQLNRVITPDQSSHDVTYVSIWWCLTCTGRALWRSWSSGREATEGCRTDTPWGTCKGTIMTLRWAIGINTHNPRKIVILKMLTKKMVTKISEETNIFFHLYLLQTIRWGCWQGDRFIAEKR